MLSLCRAADTETSLFGMQLRRLWRPCRATTMRILRVAYVHPWTFVCHLLSIFAVRSVSGTRSRTYVASLCILSRPNKYSQYYEASFNRSLDVETNIVVTSGANEGRAISLVR
jgi:hypothetical protein